MTRIVRIFTDLVLVPHTQMNEKTAGKRDQHQKICVHYFVSRYALVVASVSSVCHYQACA